MIQIPTTEIQVARRFLTRFRIEKNSAPAMRHVLASIENGGLVLAMAGDDLRLESRIPNATLSGTSARFLIPGDALREAAEGGSENGFNFDWDCAMVFLKVAYGYASVDVMENIGAIDEGRNG